MSDDRQRLTRIKAEQDRALPSYLRHEVAPYSAFYRNRLADVASVRRVADLGRLPLTSLTDVDDPADLVLRPELDQVLAHGETGLRVSMRIASFTGQAAKAAGRRIDPQYKPLHWVLSGGTPAVPIGSSASDLDRLAELGRRWLEQAGVRPNDVLVSVLPAGPHLAFWQLQLGARRGGVSTLLLDGPPDPAELAQLRPTVLAGAPDDLLQLLPAVELPGLTTILAVGEPLEGSTRQRLRDLSSGAEVVAAWAPPGVRALWAECRGGDAFHTWPRAEVIEVVDGELVWTALGWRGSVLVRLRTGVLAELDDGQCPVCGRTTPRLRVTGDQSPLVAALDARPEIGRWHAELRTADGADELIVFVAPADGRDPDGLTPALRELDQQIGVTQFVVVDPAEVDAMLATNGRERVADRRTPDNR